MLLSRAAVSTSHGYLIAVAAVFALQACGDGSADEPSEEAAVSAQRVADATAAEDPQPDLVGIYWDGSGCKPASTPPLSAEEPIDLRPGTFDVVASEPGRTANRSCRFTFSAALKPGFRFAVRSFVLRGAASVAAGASAQVEASTGTATGPRFALEPQRLTGPFEGSFTFEHRVPDDQLRFGRCIPDADTAIDVRAILQQASAESAFGHVAIESLSNVKFALQRCPD